MSLLTSFRKSQSFCEQVLLEDVMANIDAEGGVIRNVKVLGRSSVNGRTYSDRALREAAERYAGMEVNINHPNKTEAAKTRGLAESWGELRDSRVSADGVYANLHFLTKHPATPWLLERIEKGFSIGLSHNAQGVIRPGKDQVVESIAKVHSVDVVARPATNITMFESEDSPVTKTIKAIFTEHKATAPALAALMEDAMADPVMGEIPVEMAPEANADGQIKSAFRAMVMAAFDDESLDSSATVTRIREILKAQDKLLGGDDPASDEPKGDESPVAESIQALTEQIQQLTRRQQVADLLESVGLTRVGIGEERYQTLAKAGDTAAMKSLIESWPPAVRGAKLPPMPRAASTDVAEHVPLKQMARR
jgi:hypothetical protein